MSSNSLKQQFQLLQQQQKKRLEKQQKKKNDGNDKEEQTAIFCSCPHDEETEKFDNFDGLEDELNLRLSPTMQTDDYKDLQETIRELRDENGRVLKLLGEKEEEIKIIRRRWKEDKKELTGGGVGSENAASKIIEFSKRIREMTAELEKEKTKAQNFKKKYLDLEKATGPPVAKVEPTQEAKDEMEHQLSLTKDKLTQVLLKSAEERNEIENLKKDLKIAQKVLTREVGEQASFQSLLNANSTWRGRQQQILTLQQKVNELQQQVGDKSSKSRNALLSGISQHDEKHRLVMRKIELERKEQQEKLHKELETITEERNSFKEKNSAARARNKILTQDLKNLKEQIATFVEKGKHDDELVSALLREQQYLKEENQRQKDQMTKLNNSTGERVLRASGKVTVENNENEVLVTKLQDEVKLQEDKVKKLELEMLTLKNNKVSEKSHTPKPPSASGRRSDKRRPFSASALSSIQEPIELQLQEAKSLSEVASVEKDKLGELVQVLQRRNEELTQDLLAKDFSIAEHRNENLKLEKRLEKISIIQNNNNNTVRIRSSSNKVNTKKPNDVKIKTKDELEEDMMELETKLSIQLDNNDALKEALSTALQAKDDDLRVFHDMVEQSKKIFLQGLRQYKQTVVT